MSGQFIPGFFSDRQFIYHLDSHNRLDPENSPHEDAEYKIEITNGTIEDYDTVVCLSTSVPKSYYCIESGFNTFILRETDGITPLDITITIPIGTYSATQFKRDLQDLMTATSLSDGYGYTYTITFSSITAKFTYTISDNSNNQFSIITTNNVHEQLGFLGSSINTSVGDVLISSTVIDMSPENDLFIRSNLVDGSGANSNIFQDLQGSGVPPFGRIQYYQHDIKGYSKGLNNTSNVYRFTITNEDDEGAGQRILQLNDKNWTCTILFYKSSTLPSFLKDALKLIAMK